MKLCPLHLKSYRFDGDDIAEIIPENDGTQTKKSISDKQRFEI